MLNHIKKCTETEARRQLKDDRWPMSMEEFEAFIGIWYMRGATGAKGLELNSLWSENWGLPLCKKALSRDRFKEILRYFRIDIKSTRSERLKKDKFAHI